MADSMADPIGVVLADDHYLVREGTRRLLELADDIDVLAAVSTAEELLDAVHRLRPRVVVTDIRMPAADEGIQAAKQIRAEQHGVGIVVLSQHADPAYALELLAGGASGIGYLLKERVGDLEELILAVREVAAGRSVIDTVIVDGLVRRRAHTEQSPVSRLTTRELDVLRAMAEGRTNSTIAATLHLSTSSVEKHVNVIFTKLDLPPEAQVHRRVAAVVAYLRHPPPA